MRRRLQLELARILRPPDVTIAHWFQRPPYGGSNQFLLALRTELRCRGLRVGEHVVAPRTRACVLNSFAFDSEAIRRMLHPGCRVVHRVDGPVALSRGRDDGTDELVARLNAELAHATIFQSRYSLDASRVLGLDLRNPVVISNAVDPAMFHPPATRDPFPGRPLRVIATSWSDNPRKGAEVLEWLDRNLDLDSYELTFAGRTQARLERIRVVGPLASEPLAELMRAHDVYLAASRDDPCSNALLEALACGLPAAFRRSGGHPELVGEAGIGFDDSEELPDVFARLAAELGARRAAIHVPALSDVADRYLATMGIDASAP